MPNSDDGPIVRKARSLGMSLDGSSPPQLEDAFNYWCTQVRATTFGGLVMDYDGTMCFTRRRFELPPANVRAEVLRLLEAGMIIGIASGRGKSLHADLRAWVPNRLWSQLVVGLYSGALRVDLDADVPESSTPSNLMQAVIERLITLPVSHELRIEARSTQVSVAPNSGSFLNRGRLRAVIADVLARDPALAVKTVASAHSIDIVPIESSKRTIVDLVAMASGRSVMTIGDQGDIGGNDHELLAAVAPSITVDACSPDLTRCWYLDGAGRSGPALLTAYLAALHPVPDGFSFGWDPS